MPVNQGKLKALQAHARSVHQKQIHRKEVEETLISHVMYMLNKNN